MSSAAAAAAVKDYSPAAISLFNNMKTPASILGGAMIGLGFLSPLPQPPPHIQNPKTITLKKKNGKQVGTLGYALHKNTDRMLRKLHLLVTICSFGSELLAVMWSTVAVNQLTETMVPPTGSVWELLQLDWYDLAWSGTNAHFVIGMLGFMFIVGTRAFLMVQARPWNANAVVEAGEEEKTACSMATAATCMVGASLLLMVSIVNRGVANGGGQGVGDNYGGSVWSLLTHYVKLLMKQSLGLATFTFGPLEIVAIFLAGVSLVMGARAVFVEP